MSWLANLFATSSPSDQRLPFDQQQRLRDWWQLAAVDLSLPHRQSRYVVVDVEGGGNESPNHRPIVIGAVAVVNGLIGFKDAFQLSLPEEGASFSTAIDLQVSQGLLDFLHFVGKSPLVFYHAMFAAKSLEGILASKLRFELVQPRLDLALVMPDLFRELGESNWRLDTWLEHFKIDSIDRQRAVSDAYATAQLLQIAQARAAKNGFPTPESLFELEKARRQMYPNG